MAIYGRTWWGKKWLETFTGIDYDNRLSRGRTYANTGRARDIKIQGHKITAKVQGSWLYDVSVVLNQFSRTDKETIHQIISSYPSILSALINKQLPEQLLGKMNQHHIKLFPSNWQEIKAECNCPDWAMPCKHIAAVIYLICAEIDKNPFMVFQIHDCDLLTLITDFSEGQLERVQKIPHIEEMFQSFKAQDTIFNQSILDHMSFSKVQGCAVHIKAILRDDPPFYDKNFREVLCLAYKHWQRYPRGKSASDISRVLISKSAQRKLSEEEVFAELWQHPEQWDDFGLNINDKHQLTKVSNGEQALFTDAQDLLFICVNFLLSIPNTLLHKLNPALRFTHMLSQFAVKLMEQSALIPQILQNQHNEKFIRWVPALFDPEVKQIYDQLCAICPHNLVLYKNTLVSPEEQVKAALALLFSGLMRLNFPTSLDRHTPTAIFQLFFSQKPSKFTDFTNKELPSAIHQWLANLYLSHRHYKLYLRIEDEGGIFTLDLNLSFDDNKAPIPLKKALQAKETKLVILSDLSLITEYIPRLAESIDHGTRLSFTLDDFAPLFLDIVPVLKAIGIRVSLPKSLQKILKPQLNLSLKAKNELDRKSFLTLETLLQFDWKIAIGDKKFAIAEFKKLLQTSRGLIKFLDGYVLLYEKEMQALLKQIDKIPLALNQADLMQAALSGDLDGATVDLDHHLDTLFKQLGQYNTVAIPHNLQATLRPYQERGFNWLIQNIETGFGSILADDMGLGKTLQVIAAILYAKNQGYLWNSRVLIVAPTSLLSNWKKEFERFAPDLNVFIYHGQNRVLAAEYDVMLTSYGLARRDRKELNKIRWFLLVIDEAQNIKNPLSEQTKAIKTIDAKHKIAMSGTPVENRLLEYWSIFDFTNKHYLGTPAQFKGRFASPIEKERDKDCLERFKKVTGPFILRRLKSDKNIIQDLPDKIETNRYCALTAEQAALYQETVDLSLKAIDKSEGIERKGLVLKLINALKQICNHPSQFVKKKQASIEQSGKMSMLEEILFEIETLAEKTLIFTQYVEMGTIMAKLLGEKFQTTIPFLHGGLARKARDEMVNHFQNSSSARTFIVSLKAGGTGLNLTAASHVVHYDLWWNPAVEAQATDRAYRIGQERNVMVHRFLTTGTFEERIDEMIQRKKELANLTVGSGENWITEMSTEQLKDMINLRKVA